MMVHYVDKWGAICISFVILWIMYHAHVVHYAFPYIIKVIFFPSNKLDSFKREITGYQYEIQHTVWFNPDGATQVKFKGVR